MERKRAMALAAATTVVSISAALAVGANVGMFGLGSVPTAPAMPIRADAAAPSASAAPQNEVRYVDVPVTVKVPAGGSVTLPPEAVSGANSSSSAAATGPTGAASASVDTAAAEPRGPAPSGNHVEDDHHNDARESTTSTTEPDSRDD